MKPKLYLSILYISTIVNIQSIFYDCLEVDLMITYEPFYRRLKEKNITTYKLITQHNVSRSLIDRLKHNKPITTVTLNDLCKILGCKIEDIVEYVED